MATPPDTAIVSTRATGLAVRSSSSVNIAPADGELLRLFARQEDNSDAAFAQLMDRHAAMVMRVCRQILNRRQDAEDVFQVTFLLLARRARAVRASESAAGWLYRVAYRTAMAKRKRDRRRKEKPMDDEPLAPPEAAFPDLAGRETAAILMQELDKLPEKYRLPLVLRYLEGQSRHAIADQTDSTVAAVQGRLARGKQLLRSRLVRRGVSLSAAMAVVAGGGAASHASEPVPTALVAQTSSNATAVVTGSSLTASVVVVSLFREGVRAMFVSQMTKPVAAMVAAGLIAAVVAVGPTLGDALAQAPAESEPAIVLDTAVVEEVEEPISTVAIDLQESTEAKKTESPARSDKNEITIYSLKYSPAAKTAELLREVVDSRLCKISQDDRTNRLIVSAPKEMEAEISLWIQKLDIPSPNQRKDVKGEDSTITRAFYDISDFSPAIMGTGLKLTKGLAPNGWNKKDSKWRYSTAMPGSLRVTASLAVHKQIKKRLEKLREKQVKVTPADANLAKPGSMVTVKWTQNAQAVNGSYRKTKTTTATVDADGVVELRLLSPIGLTHSAPTVFYVKGKTPLQIEQAVQKYLTSKGTPKSDAEVENVVVGTPKRNAASGGDAPAREVLEAAKKPSAEKKTAAKTKPKPTKQPPTPDKLLTEIEKLLQQAEAATERIERVAKLAVADYRAKMKEAKDAAQPFGGEFGGFGGGGFGGGGMVNKQQGPVAQAFVSLAQEDSNRVHILSNNAKSLMQKYIKQLIFNEQVDFSKDKPGLTKRVETLGQKFEQVVRRAGVAQQTVMTPYQTIANEEKKRAEQELQRQRAGMVPAFGLEASAEPAKEE